MGGYQGLLNTFDHFMSTLPISRLKQGTIASLVVEHRVLHTPHMEYHTHRTVASAEMGYGVACSKPF
jgi:hypothetical protein